MDQEQCFVVGVSSRGRPVEGSCDHGFVIDYSELVVQLVSAREARGADAFEGLTQRLITRFYLARVIRKADPQQVKYFREGSARKTRIGDQPDFNASLDLFPQHVGELLAENTNRAISRLFFAAFSRSAKKLSP